MTTQIIEAKKGNITEQMEYIAKKECVTPGFLREKVASGRVVILKNNRREDVIPTGVGEGLTVKINANIGTSMERSDLQTELDKVRIIELTGADVLMDLSTGNDIDSTRKAILAATKLPIGTVPMYQAGKEAFDDFQDVGKLSKDKLFADIEKQCRDGVDFITVHCGVTKFVVEQLERQGRVTDIVSRGGSMLACRIKATGEENPLYEYYDELLEIAREYDCTLSLGDGLRPGCGNDAGDRAQVAETMILGELVKRARDFGVQAMVEGPGHVPLNKIPAMMETIKVLTDYAPLYVLGPLVTDIAPGYDHITSAIGGTLAAYHGADFLCYVTPAEHLGLPDVKQVREGIIASKISAHAADIARGNKAAIERDRLMSEARKNLDWEAQRRYALDKCVFEGVNVGEPCTMCGKYCSMKIFNEYFAG
ncbi:MAG: phosphomethylpyrimidine synthase ThiC [Heliobacteriaceae bacterium]|jgi:phosphomethylpyrimidine synthase|nr:phosphomethylpyrimidine synthase ThiC [Heliobacteriaceae bacterium]